MPFLLSQKSLDKLKPPVHKDLAAVVKRGLHKSAVAYEVTEALRSVKRQSDLLASGATWTMDSRHLTGHAVDLVAMVSGNVRWDWPLYYDIARAMRIASLELCVPLTWGGVWDTPLDKLTDDLEAEVSGYAMRMKRKGKRAKADGPHFELLRSVYP